MVATDKQAEYKVLGTRPIRPDGVDKVTGRAQYGADVKLPGMVYGTVLRSPHAHARIKSIDTSKAEKLPGVLAVITGANMPIAESKDVEAGEEVANYRDDSYRVMAHDKAGFKGQPVAAVAALDMNTALEAAKLIKVDYEALRPAINVDEAMAPNAPIIVEYLVGDHLGEDVPNTNVAKHARHTFGDVDAGFKAASVVVEREFQLSTVHQGYIEPQNATAFWNNDGQLTIWTSTQGAFWVRTSVAGILMVPISQIKVVPMEIGGGFGGKIGVYLEPVAALLSKKCGRPVKMQMDRKSVFEATGPAPAGKVKVKVGVDAKGKITAATADVRYEAGAFPGASIGPAAGCIFAPYKVENTFIDTYDVVVNKSKSAAYRAPGAPQVAFAMESVVDEVAEKLGMDPLEFRLLNASQEGDRRADGPKFPRIGNIEVLQAAQASPHWQSKLEHTTPDGKLRGRGIASGFWFNGGMKSSVNINVTTDGSVTLVEGSTDIGGSRASIAMQAAEVLGLRMEDVHPYVADTNSVGYNDVTGGSRTTNTSGLAAYNAAQKVVTEMTARAAKLWDVEVEGLQFEDGVFSSKSDPELKLTFKELAAKLDQTGGPVGETGSAVGVSGAGGFGTHIVDVEVDPETGKVDVLRYTSVQDAGKAIHPSYVEGQMQGGAAQGIGWALNEEYVMSGEGAMENATFLDYRMPTAYDLPMIETVIVEVPNPFHPFGVRGVGETPIVPALAAVANAVHDATGARFPHLPIKPGRILESLAAKNGS